MGSTATEYIPTTTNPVTIRSCKGLLIEEARTNSFSKSEEFNDVFWSKTRTSLSANAITAPDGTLTADKLVEDTTVSNTHTINNTTIPAVPATLSIFAKKGERKWIVLRVNGSNDFFNLDTGTVTTNVNSPTITDFGNGWYRCSVLATAVTQSSFQMSADGINTSYTGDGTSGIYIWGAQFETGSFATSYIPTTTASRTRGEDSCTITGASFASFFNQSEGTLFVSANEFRRGTSYSPILRIANSTIPGNNRYSIGTYGNKTGSSSPLEFLTTTNSVQVYAVTLNSPTSNFKASLAYKVDDMRSALNGTLLTADTPPSALVVGANTMAIGSVGMHIDAVRYYRKRLPNEQQVELTT